MTSKERTGRQLVIHVVYRFAVGGLENGVVNLVNRLPADRWRHAILSLTDVCQEFCRRIERPDVEYLALHKGPGHLTTLYPRIFRILRERSPAIVHTRNLAALEILPAAWAARIPVRIHGEHGWDVSDLTGKSARYRLVRQIYRPLVSRYVALSKHIAGYLERGVGVRRGRITQIYNGVDTARFHPAANGRDLIPDSPFNDPDLWVVGTVGRMQTVKDQVTLAEAFVRLLRAYPEARRRLRLVMAGDGPMRAQVAATLDQAGAADLAWLPGERADIPQLMRGMNAFALPSLAEGISNTILEAMASGLPVLATDVGGNPELVENRVTGRLVPARNAAAFAEVLGEYFRAPALARRHGLAGRGRVKRHFSLDRMAAEYEQLYCDLVARGAGGGVMGVGNSTERD